jgi:hypothetical protein
VADLLQNLPSDERKTNGKHLAKTWGMLCEAIADTLQDVSAEPFPNLGMHIANMWQITCSFSPMSSAQLEWREQCFLVTSSWQTHCEDLVSALRNLDLCIAG